MRANGYDESAIAHVGALIRKERLKSDVETQMLEDVACVVFLEHYLGDFQARTLFSKMPAPMNMTTAQTLIRLDDALLMFAGSFKDADSQAVRQAPERGITALP